MHTQPRKFIRYVTTQGDGKLPKPQQHANHIDLGHFPY